MNKDYSKISAIDKAVPYQGAQRLDVWLDMFMRRAALARSAAEKTWQECVGLAGLRILNISPLGEVSLIEVELADWLKARGRHVTGITVRSGRVAGGKVGFLSRLFQFSQN